MKITKLLTFTLIIIFGHITFLSTLGVLFSENLYIEWNYDNKLVIIILILVVGSTGIVSYLISKIFEKNIYEVLAKSTIGVLISLFSLNIYTFIKSILSIIKYNDKIFECKFFTIRYIYTKEELIKFVKIYYNKISSGEKNLTRKERIQILGDAKTIESAKANVEAYINYEKTFWWPKVQEVFNSVINWGLDHPILFTAGFATASTIVLYPIYKILVNQYNISSISDTVSNLAEHMQKEEDKFTHIENALNSLSNAVSLLSKAVVKLNINAKDGLTIIASFINIEFLLVDSLGLNASQKNNVKAYFVSFTERLAELLVETETPLTLPSEDQITFIEEEPEN